MQLGSSSPDRSVVFRPLACVLLLGVAAAVAAGPEERVGFVAVALDVETRQADKKLQDFLYRKAGVAFAPEELEYERVVERLAGWRWEDGPFLARTTPYVHVVAEMLGADFEVLATYVSAATGRTTYHSYFVVNRRDFPAPPSLRDVLEFLAARKQRARFAYHSRFSTSSYFLPALQLRAQKVFHMPEPTESLAAIDAEKIEENSSTKLVEMVAEGGAEIAAVWDGTKKKFEPGASEGRYERFGRQVHFVKLPAPLPNDLLVCSRWLDPAVKERLRSAIASMGSEEIAVGDFRTWRGIQEARETREALAELRYMARERVPPVTVETRLLAGVDGARHAPLVEAARQAVRLSGTEFVPFDEDFHAHIDFKWSLEPTHDGAVVLRSSIPGSEVPEQVFRLSFRDPEDLTRRIVSLVQSRMHRIRHVWSYSGATPIVIRDTTFSLPAGATAMAQKIRWLDPERNKALLGPLFRVRIRDSGYYRYVLEPGDFAQSGETPLDLDPLSNVSYRVLMLRPSEERLLFRTLTVVFVALLALASGFALVDLWRPARRAAAPAPPPVPSPGP